MKLKEVIPILPVTFLVYDMSHENIFDVAHYRMLYVPKNRHYLDYHVYVIEASDKHILVNIMED